MKTKSKSNQRWIRTGMVIAMIAFCLSNFLPSRGEDPNNYHWRRYDYCTCTNGSQGHFHVCTVYPSDFSCSGEDLGYVTSCQDNATNVNCGSALEPIE